MLLVVVLVVVGVSEALVARERDEAAELDKELDNKYLDGYLRV